MPAVVRHFVLEYHEDFEVCSLWHEKFRSDATKGDSTAQIGDLARLCHRFVELFDNMFNKFMHLDVWPTNCFRFCHISTFSGRRMLWRSYVVRWRHTSCFAPNCCPWGSTARIPIGPWQYGRLPAKCCTSSHWFGCLDQVIWIEWNSAIDAYDSHLSLFLHNF